MCYSLLKLIWKILYHILDASETFGMRSVLEQPPPIGGSVLGQTQLPGTIGSGGSIGAGAIGGPLGQTQLPLVGSSNSPLGQTQLGSSG